MTPVLTGNSGTVLCPDRRFSIPLDLNCAYPGIPILGLDCTKTASINAECMSQRRNLHVPALVPAPVILTVLTDSTVLYCGIGVTRTALLPATGQSSVAVQF